MDIHKLMQQAKEVQRQMVGVQAELANKQVSSVVGGGMVAVTVNGHSEMAKLTGGLNLPGLF